VPALVGLGVLIVLARGGPRSQRASSRPSRTGVALAVLSPWYVRNAVEVGDPMHPFGYGAFHGRNWSAQAAAYLNTYYDQYRTRGKRASAAASRTAASRSRGSRGT
jgi:hypothetical protein